MKNRRSFLKLTGIGSMGFFALKSMAGGCDLVTTPPQPEGPFYPLVPGSIESDTDLTQLKGRTKTAKGRIVFVSGIVTDERCRPLKNAIVEVWQACHSGKYNHPADTSGNELDENFQYYGIMKTDSNGKYSFKSIIPGAYEASPTWIRPPHIHFKVNLKGYEQLITQLYFEGEKYNDQDEYLKALSEYERKKLIIKFKKGFGQFDLTLKKL